MTRSAAALSAILRYMIDQKELDPSRGILRVVRDAAQDRLNAKNPRSFCYVLPRDPHIYCAGALEHVPEPFRCGILLHEVGHVAMNAFKGSISEPVVDSFILLALPESGYTYKDCDYRHNGDVRTARNIQWVSPKWVRRLA